MKLSFKKCVFKTPWDYLAQTRWRTTCANKVIAGIFFGFSLLPTVSFADPPDLAVTAISTTDMFTDLQTLQVSGKVQVTVDNLGTVVSEPTHVILFEDTNQNGLFDNGIDNKLGSGEQDSLAPDTALTLEIPVNGKY
jgi:hypothetical protein